MFAHKTQKKSFDFCFFVSEFFLCVFSFSLFYTHQKIQTNRNETFHWRKKKATGNKQFKVLKNVKNVAKKGGGGGIFVVLIFCDF